MFPRDLVIFLAGAVLGAGLVGGLLVFLLLMTYFPHVWV